MAIDQSSMAIGKMEGELEGVKNRLDRIDSDLAEIKIILSSIQGEDNQRKGMTKIWIFLAGVLGSALAGLVDFMLKRLGDG